MAERSALPRELAARRKARINDRVPDALLSPLPRLSAVVRAEPRALAVLRGNVCAALVEAGGPPKPGEVLAAVTGGQWSLLDLLRDLLTFTGPARVRVTTWTMGVRDAEVLAALRAEGAITELECFVDSSMPVREAEYVAHIVALLGRDSIVCTNTHMKIATIRAPGWVLAVEGSMNLNDNPRFETAVVFHSPVVAGLYDEVLDSIAAAGQRLDTPRREVNAEFARLTGHVYPGAAPVETREARLARLRAERGVR